MNLVRGVALGALLWASSFAKDPAAPPESQKPIQGGGIYADDLGPDTLDVSAYPEDIKKGYLLLVEKCAKCHSAARPLNAPFVDLAASEVAALKKTQPELFKDPAVWRMDEGVWERYTKRMGLKSRSDVSRQEAAAIRQFLVYDSKHRKIGAAAATWKAHRLKLLEQFKARFPETYFHLYSPKTHE